MGYCSNCGNELDDEDMFCSRCGAITPRGVEKGVRSPLIDPHTREEVHRALQTASEHIDRAMKIAINSLREATRGIEEGIRGSESFPAKYCNKCGSKNQADARYCEKCGAELE